MSLRKPFNLYGNPGVMNIPQCTHDIPPRLVMVSSSALWCTAQTLCRVVIKCFNYKMRNHPRSLDRKAGVFYTQPIFSLMPMEMNEIKKTATNWNVGTSISSKLKLSKSCFLRIFTHFWNEVFLQSCISQPNENQNKRFVYWNLSSKTEIFSRWARVD